MKPVRIIRHNPFRIGASSLPVHLSIRRYRRLQGRWVWRLKPIHVPWAARRRPTRVARKVFRNGHQQRRWAGFYAGARKAAA